ncbi:MAG: hypothetical protein AMXMBFR4_03320 [Candidatus Hydrogenedentota bacterium]
MSHRKATLKSLALALFKHNAITTTVPKSKELRKFAEPLITLARQDTVANRRQAFAELRDKAVVAKLFTEIAPAYADRNGGYTRILRLGHRLGDAAPLARIELVGLGEHKEE